MVTSHQGWSVLSSGRWWPPLERLPNCQASHWTPSWPLDHAAHVDKVDINSPNQESPIFFWKKPSRFHWSLTHPGVRFSCFPEEKTLTPVQCCVRWPECKGICLAFRSRKNYTVATNQSGLLFPCFPSSPRVFCVRIYFFTGENSVVFFCMLFFVGIWAVFVCPVWTSSCCNHAAVLALAASKHNSLVLTFPPVLFLPFYIFFCDINLFTVFAVLMLCFLLCCFGRAAGAFFVFGVVLSAS